LNLTDALGLGAHEVVAITGAGGKTGALYRMAAECRARGQTVIATTTTHMWPPDPAAGWPLLLGNVAEQRPRIAALLEAEGRAFVARAFDPSGRLQGIAPDEVASLVPLADIVLVEADGARGLWLKAPAAYEPAIPPSATLVVPVAGLQALGRPLGPQVVHRPERVAELLQVPAGAAISEEMVAALLTHRQGALQGVPAGARVVAFCNQAEGQAARMAGRRIAARALRARGPLQRVVVGSLREDAQAFEAWAPTAVTVLAAGESRRFGGLKQAELWQGRSLLQRAVDAALASLATEVRVVLGCQAEALLPLLAGYGDPRLRIVMNPSWAEGQASSVRAGLASVGATVEAAVFCAADQPLLTAAEIDALLVRHAATGAGIVAPSVAGQLRSPVLFARRLFAELADLRGDTGGRAVIARHRGEVEAVEAADPAPYTDIDSREDLRRLANREGGNRRRVPWT
jgi:molybdenum cofactor cytidylyltransferase